MNGSPCAIGLKPNITAPIDLPAASGQSDLSSFVATGYVTTNGNQIIDVDGNVITLNGANWFGFETQVCKNLMPACFALEEGLKVISETSMLKSNVSCDCNMDCLLLA